MIPAVIPGMEANAVQPKDWDVTAKGRVGDLPIRRVEINGIAFLESAWEPTPEELADLNAGGKVLLRLSVAQHPITGLSVSKPEPEISDLTYAVVGGDHPDDIIIWDEAANQPLGYVVEVNTVEGWAVVHDLDDRGEVVIENNAIKTKRISGQFTIRRPAGASRRA